MKDASFLSLFHNQKMDGFDFCKLAGTQFEASKNQVNGVNEMRLRTGPLKKFVEEIVPLGTYIRSIYLYGMELRVKWVNGNQKYDAIIWASGTRVRRGYFPKRRFIEITHVMHEKEYLLREQLVKNGVAFSAKSISRNKKTGEIEAKPYVYRGDEHTENMVDLIVKRIEAKNKLLYPSGTDLLIHCVPDTLVFSEEWEQLWKMARQRVPKNRFGKIILLESMHGYLSTIQNHGKIIW